MISAPWLGRLYHALEQYQVNGMFIAGYVAGLFTTFAIINFVAYIVKKYKITFNEEVVTIEDRKGSDTPKKSRTSLLLLLMLGVLAACLMHTYHVK